MKRLYESLLDDDDKLFADTSDPVYNKQLNDPQSEIRTSLLNINTSLRRGYTSNIPITSGIEYKSSKKELTVKTDSDKAWIETTRFSEKVLNDFLPGIETLSVLDNNGGIKIWPRYKTIDSSYLCKNIEAPTICMFGNQLSEIKDMNLITIGKTFSGIKIETFMQPVTFNNVKFINNGDKLRSSLNFDFIPIFNNTTGKDFKRMRIYECGLFDDADAIWDKVFDWNYVGNTIDGKPKKINNIKKLVATANNPKRYAPAPNNNLYKLVDGFKLTDLIDISKFTGLNRIIIENNHVTIAFVKPTDLKASGIIFHKSLLGQKSPISKNIEDSFDIPKTADGWYCVVFKND